MVHLRSVPPNFPDTRAPHVADPPSRAGSASYAFQAKAYAEALRAYENKEIPHKPEAMDFDSVVREPMIYMDGPPEYSMSLIPLHLFLGTSLKQVNALEWELKVLDARWSQERGVRLSTSKSAGEKKSLDEKLRDAENWISVLHTSIETHSNLIFGLTSSIELMKSTPESANGIERGKKTRSRKKDYQPLPGEDEYRDACANLLAAQQAETKAKKDLIKSHTEVVKLYSSKAGPFVRAFYDLMDTFNLERQAYHSSALNGNDCHKIFQPSVSDQFAKLLAPRLACDLEVVPGLAGETPRVRLVLSNVQGIGDRARSDLFAALWRTIGEASSLWTRKEPLCEHEIDRFGVLADRFAIEYSILFPEEEPTPKMHFITYHLLRQMRWLGTSGMLHEGVVEAFHVIDNRHVLRWANVKDPEANVWMRARAAWSLSAVKVSIRALDHEREVLRRDKGNTDARHMYAEYERRREERLAQEEAEAA